MTGTTSYVLDSSQDEIDRLLRAARMLSPIAASGFRQAGLRPGDRAIDLGCGPLGALADLCDIVRADGSEGVVVGVDMNPAALATARLALDRLGATGVRLVEADINTLTPEQVGGGFDLAHCRLVLMHQADPAATLRTIAGLLRPGGALVAVDFFAPPRLEPGLEPVDRAWDLIVGATRARGASPDASRRYREFCQAAGFEVVGERGTFLPMPPPAVLNETTVLLTAARRGVEAAGLATAAEVDALLAELAAATGTVTGRGWSPETIELIARKKD